MQGPRSNHADKGYTLSEPMRIHRTLLRQSSAEEWEYSLGDEDASIPHFSHAAQCLGELAAQCLGELAAQLRSPLIFFMEKINFIRRDKQKPASIPAEQPRIYHSRTFRVETPFSSQLKIQTEFHFHRLQNTVASI